MNIFHSVNLWIIFIKYMRKIHFIYANISYTIKISKQCTVLLMNIYRQRAGIFAVKEKEEQNGEIEY